MMWKLLLLMVMLLQLNKASAQKQLQFDTSHISARSFNDNAINKLKQEKEFQYDVNAKQSKSLWQRIWIWIWTKISEILSTKNGRVTFTTVFVLLALAGLGFFIYKVVGMNKAGLLARSSNANINYAVGVEDINNISFEEAIGSAIQTANYRLAIRLLYLQSLKKLSDKGYINWQVNKTNSDYLKEVSGRNWAPLFATLTNSFDYVWYGETKVNREQFAEVQQQFKSFYNQL